jgi:hypothetical protein
MKNKLGISIAVVILLMISSVYGLYRYNFPCGSDHRCDKCLWFALREYAEKHNGKFPYGEATPEASLSRIDSLRDPGDYADLLRRRDVSEDVVRQILKSGSLLDPQTCGWNYVEGLSLKSDPNLALFWDKEGLSEIGMRLSEGGHFVSFVSHAYEYIPASRWDAFLEEQKQLHEKEKMKKDEQRKLLEKKKIELQEYEHSLKKKFIDDIMSNQ